MKFRIDFNREVDDKTLEMLDAQLESTGSTKYPPFEEYVIEINTFEQLEELLKKVDNIKKGMYSAIINFDPATIYLDKDC